MSDDWKADRSLEETGSLKELYSDASVPASLEDRTMASLRRRGLLGNSRVLWRKRVTRVLAPAAALFLLGFALGRMDDWGNEPPGRAQYMILLFESPGLPTPSRIDEGRMVEE